MVDFFSRYPTCAEYHAGKLPFLNFLLNELSREFNPGLPIAKQTQTLPLSVFMWRGTRLHFVHLNRFTEE